MASPTKPEPPTSKLLSGFIRSDEIYTVTELQRRLGIRQSGWRALKRNGLRFYQVGRRVFVFGQDFFDYVRRSNPPE